MIDIVLKILAAYGLVMIALKLVKNPGNWPAYLQFVPVAVFMGYARYYGMSFETTWRGAFLAAAATSVVVYVIQYYHRIIIDRLMLGINFFFVTGAVGFLLNLQSLLAFYDQYKGVAIILNILVVGILTTIFSPLGFIGKVHPKNDRLIIIYYSCTLIMFVLIVLAEAYFLNDYGLVTSAAMPLVCLRILRDAYVKEFDRRFSH